MKLRQLVGMRFKSARLALTDIHNAGSIFGIIYSQVLTFKENGHLTMVNEIEISQGGLAEWKKKLEDENWVGTYKFDLDDKHVKCILINEKTKVTKVVFADFASDNILMCEVYNGESHGQGQVFEKI